MATVCGSHTVPGTLVGKRFQAKRVKYACDGGIALFLSDCPGLAAFRDDGVRQGDGNESGRYALPYADYHGFL
jgi:hypothetical protein